MTAGPLPVSSSEFFDVVQAHLDGVATADDMVLLNTHQQPWIAALLRLLDEASVAIDRANRELKGHERSLVVADFEREWQRIDDVLTQLVGPADSPDTEQPKPAEVDNTSRSTTAGVTQVQLAWTPGRVVAWASGHNAEAAGADELMTMLSAAGAESIGWETYNSIKVPNQGRAPAVWAPIGSCLGWLASLASGADRDPKNPEPGLLGPSAVWIGLVTTLAIRQVAQGRMVPLVKKARRSAETPKGTETSSPFEVRWGPALVDQAEHESLCRGLTGSVGVIIGYDEALSHLLQGGSDAILIPSRFEPCGLTQLYGLR